MNQWNQKIIYAIGGLQNVGYVTGEDVLIVLSLQGAGIIDCLSGARLARNNKENWWDKFDEKNATVTGFDFLADVRIKTHGLFGGDSLYKRSLDGWKLSKKNSSSIFHFLKFKSSKREIVNLHSPNGRESKVVHDVGPCELRAYGFSDTGKSFIIASTCELVIYRRAN